MPIGNSSGKVGHHFAGAGNPFWKLLHTAGLTPIELKAEEDTPPDALAEWQAVAQAGYRMIVDKAVPAATVGEVERLRDAYRATHKSN